MSDDAITTAIDVLENKVLNPSEGLPDEIFYYISKTTPLVNVDLLIKDEDGRTLLAWRDDQFAGSGWLLPGGIVRFKETLEIRIQKVAKTEIGILVDFDPNPVTINQIIANDRKIRSHFISILYKCFLSKENILVNNGLFIDDPGYIMWYNNCPHDLLEYHEIYRNYF
tara:strand:- start:386 stop:889 length:504 start_codon:yes stop_codon:yes gene_type:complete